MNTKNFHKYFAGALLAATLSLLVPMAAQAAGKAPIQNLTLVPIYIDGVYVGCYSTGSGKFINVTELGCSTSPETTGGGLEF